MARQLERRREGSPKIVAERTLEEIFKEQGIAGPSTTIKYEARAGSLPLEDDESAIMSGLDSQQSDVAAHPGYPFWRYKRVLCGAPTLFPDPIADGGISQKADYMTSNVEKHNEEPTICSTVGTKTGRDGRSVPKIQHYRRPFTQPILCPSTRSHTAACYKQVTRSGTNEGKDIDELAER